MSFNFKLLHGLLVTRQRLHHLTPAASPTCTDCEADVEEDLQHALVDCNLITGVGRTLHHIVQSNLPDVTAAAMLRLELINLVEEAELSTVTFISAFLQEVWNKT